MLSGRVDAVAATQGFHPAQDVLCASLWDIVQVQGDNIPASHGIGLAARAVQYSRHKAAHILQPVLLALLHGQVLGLGLGASGRRLQAIIQLLNGHCLGLPVDTCPAAAHGYDNLSIV